MGKRNSIKPKYIAFIFFTTHFKEEDKTKQKKHQEININLYTKVH